MEGKVEVAQTFELGMLNGRCCVNGKEHTNLGGMEAVCASLPPGRYLSTNEIKELRAYLPLAQLPRYLPTDT